MKILVTGAAGSIGSNLIKKLSKNHNHEIFAVDNFGEGKLENLVYKDKPLINLNKNFYKLDLTKYSNCLKITKNIDLIVHLADIVSGIDFVFKTEPFVFRQNILINSNILSAAIKNKVKKILYVGTACSYPQEKQSHISNYKLKENEVYPFNPESSYGWSKLMGEYEIELANKYGLIDTCILRFHNVYGPPCDINPSTSQVIPALCRKIIESNNSYLEVWGTGEQRRTFVYVDDAVDAIMLGIKNGFNKGVIQIGSHKSESIKNIAKTLVKISNKQTKIIFDKSKPNGDMDRVPNLMKSKKKF